MSHDHIMMGHGMHDAKVETTTHNHGAMTSTTIHDHGSMTTDENGNMNHEMSMQVSPY